MFLSNISYTISYERKVSYFTLYDSYLGTADVPILMLQQLALKSNQSVNILLPNPIHGLDPSRKMLEKGQAKINRLNYSDSIILHFGNSENMKQIFPKNNNFDAITMSFGIRNVEFRNKTLLEIKRLLRKGGRIAIMVRAIILQKLIPFNV